MKERILDLGIGEGGEYLLRDCPETNRVGVDKNFNILAHLFPESYKEKVTLLLVANAESNLPFADEVFDKVQISFPNDELLLGLCSSDFSLWAELNRVLKKDGSVDIYIDVPASDIRGVMVHGKAQRIEFPLSKIFSISESFGFRPISAKLSYENVQKLGTKFSLTAAEQMKLALIPDSLYYISAQKE